MDKYQKVIIDKSVIRTNVEDSYVNITDQIFEIIQSENAYIEDYTIKLNNETIKYIYLDKKCYEKIDKEFILDFSFTSKIRKITFVFENEIAKKLVLNMKYVHKSKEKWVEKNKEILWETLEKQANISFRPGYNLVNIYFESCSPEYVRTSISLYKANVDYQKRYNQDSYNRETFMETFNVDTNKFYEAITNLAFGAYGFKLSQYCNKDEILFTSKVIYFYLDKID